MVTLTEVHIGPNAAVVKSVDEIFNNGYLGYSASFLRSWLRSFVMINSQLSKLKSTKGFKMANLNINSLLKSIDQLRAIMVNTPLDILSINGRKLMTLCQIMK